MKKYILMFSLMLPTWAIAQTYSATESVAAIRSHTGYWGSHTWIQLEGVSNVENCNQGNAAGKGPLTYMLVPAEEKNMYSLILAAYTSGKKVQVQLDTADPAKINGFCVVRYATLM
jgi:hypothetical protein